ncbi:hypothetical protein CVS40_3012 [Lucilia cuprina]|nr:hypothetical protein CVS40_3012 [Lucilia cuprina]
MHQVKKKLQEQQRTDAELAELFNVVSITASNGHHRRRRRPLQKLNSSQSVVSSSTSRSIRKQRCEH